MFGGLLRPGQGFRWFTVLKREGNVSENGRPKLQTLSEAGKITGIISQASQKEKDQWKQAGHPITHKVIQQGAENRAQPEDVLEIEINGKVRRFLIQGVHDPAELGHFTTYFTEEREDLQ